MKHPIIALWSHPRSMSTAFERIMRARGDLACLHEPFMYDYYINRSTRQMPHFEAKDDHPVSYEEIRDMIFAKAETGPVFFKDMSYYVVPRILADDAFLDRVTHSFLIRDPKASLISYAKLDPELTLDEVGIEAQWCHVSALLKRGITPVVVQSEEVQADPLGQMQLYWTAVGLSDSPQALDWSGEAPQDWQQVAGWHQDVLSSRTVRPLTSEKVKEIADDYQVLIEHQPRFKALYEHHLPLYDRLLAFALRCGRKRKDPASLALDQ